MGPCTGVHVGHDITWTGPCGPQHEEFCWSPLGCDHCQLQHRIDMQLFHRVPDLLQQGDTYSGEMGTGGAGKILLISPHCQGTKYDTFQLIILRWKAVANLKIQSILRDKLQ